MLFKEYYKTLRLRELKKMSMKFDSPTKSDVHQDSVLSGISIMYENDEYIADRVLPVVPVVKESDLYYIYTRNWRIPEAKRAPGAEAAEVEWNVETDSYSCVEYALKGFVSDRDKDNADKPLDLEIDETNNVTGLIQLIREKRVADVVFASGSYTNTSALTGGNRWDDYAGSDPIGDVRTGRATVHAASGKTPNTMIVGKQVHDKLLDHPDVLERIKYTQKGLVTADLLATLFEVDNYIVGKALYDSSNDGGDESLGYLWGKYVSLIYVEPSPGLRKVSYGYQFQSRGFRTKKWREEGRDGAFIESGEIRDEHLVSKDCGYLYSTVVS